MHELTVGEVVLGNYRVREKLGECGMGTVLLGDDFQLGRRVAIKVLFEGRQALEKRKEPPSAFRPR